MSYQKNNSLRMRGNCWHLDIRLPHVKGNNRTRVSLKTSDIVLAREIRDKVLRTIMADSSIVFVLRKISDEIKQRIASISSELARISDQDDAPKEHLLSFCADAFLKFVKKSNLRESSRKNYRISIAKSVEALGEDKAIEHIDRYDLIKIRDKRLSDGIGHTRLNEDIRIFRYFLRWCYKEGYLAEYNRERLDVPLPTPRKINTSMIPKDLADQAMLVKKNFTLPPRIARYTGMRREEILRLKPRDIVVIHGIKCIHVDEDSKTHKARIIPIAEKLLPYFDINSRELKVKTKMVDNYNIKIKTIPGCEKCSFHSWRVYANTCMMEQGVDQAVRMKILGHVASKSDVHIGYTQVALNQMKKAVDLIP